MNLKLVLAFIVLAGPAYAEEQHFDGRKSVEDFWRSKGAAPHVASGIADNVARESAFDPARPGDGGTSFGLYQHHAERMTTLLAAVENDQAFREVMGADPIAAAHWGEIKGASSRQEAAQLWAKYFERCAACGRAPTQNTGSVATMSPLAPPDKPNPHQWHDISGGLPPQPGAPLPRHEWHQFASNN